MNSIHVFEAFTGLCKKVREEKRILTHQEFENFASEYQVCKAKKEFIAEWWDFRFMKALKLIDLNTSEEEYQETLVEYREEEERKRLERKNNRMRGSAEKQKLNFQKEKKRVKPGISELIEKNYGQDGGQA